MNTALYDVLIELGANESRARAAADAVPDKQHLATREDIAEVKVEMAELRSEVRTEIAGVKTEMAELRSELRTEMAELRSEVRTEIAGVKTEMAELRTEIAELRSEVRTEIAQLRAEMHRSIRVVGFSIIGTFLAAIAVGVVVLNRLLA